MPGLRLLALDGNDTIGGTKYLVQTGDAGVMLDFGTNFNKIGRYYEEFLKPRSTTGLLDLVTMGVIPDARGLYRSDLLLPDLELHGPEVGRIDAVLVTHSHMDHAGALGLVRPEIPIVTGALTAATLKAIQDTGKSELGRESVYASVRATYSKRGVRLIRSSNDLLGRALWVPEAKPPGEFRGFWGWLPSQVPGAKKKWTAGALLEEAPVDGLRTAPVDHSVKDARGYVLETPQGPVVYPGDIRSHGTRGGATIESFVDLARSPRPYVLFMEGTNAGEPSDELTTEADVRRNVKALLSGMRGTFVIGDFGPRNIERLEIFLEAAKEHGRSLVVTTKDAYLLHAMHSVDPAVPLPGDDLRVYDSPKGTEEKWENWVLDKYNDATVTAKTVHAAPGDFVMAFSFFDLKHLIDLRPDGGHYIYSSSEAFTEEMEIDFQRLSHWLERFGLHRHGFDFDANGKAIVPRGRGGLHASGHGPPEVLLDIVRRINPEVIVPLHTEKPTWFSESLGREYRVIIPKRCEWLEI